VNLKSVIFDAIKLRLVVYVCPQRTWCPWNVVMSILYAQRILVHILFHSFLYPLFSVYLHCKPLYSASRQPTEISESRKDKRNDTVPADIDTVIFFPFSVLLWLQNFYCSLFNGVTSWQDNTYCNGSLSSALLYKHVLDLLTSSISCKTHKLLLHSSQHCSRGLVKKQILVRSMITLALYVLPAFMDLPSRSSAAHFNPF